MFTAFATRTWWPISRVRRELYATSWALSGRDGLKDFADTERAIATPSSAQVGRGLYDEGVGQWRRYANAMDPVMPILQPWVDKFGYAGQ